MLTSLDRADQQDIGRRLKVAAGAQFVDELAVDPGGGVDVEVGQGGRGGQAGESQSTGQPASGAGLDFDGQQALQGDGQREIFGGGLVEDRGKGFSGGGQFECGQMRAQLLIAGTLPPTAIPRPWPWFSGCVGWGSLDGPVLGGPLVGGQVDDGGIG
jgi:hypothetical protein